MRSHLHGFSWLCYSCLCYFHHNGFNLFCQNSCGEMKQFYYTTLSLVPPSILKTISFILYVTFDIKISTLYKGKNTGNSSSNSQIKAIKQYLCVVLLVTTRLRWKRWFLLSSLQRKLWCVNI